jgi:hypothetical protein
MDCFCADPSNPADTDRTIFNIYSTVELPCVWSAAPGISLQKVLKSLQVIRALNSSYKASERFSISLALLDAGGNLILGATNRVTAQLQSANSFSSALEGNVQSEAKQGFVVFTDLAVTGKVGTRQLVRIQFSTPSLDKTLLISSLTPVFAVVGGNPFTLDAIVTTISSAAPNPEFEALLTLYDFYENPATIPAGSNASVTSLPDLAGSRLSMVETVVKFVDSSAILRPKIKPSEAKIFQLRFGGLGLTVDKTFEVVPGTPAALRIVYKDSKIVAWEPFRIDAAAVDDVNNVLIELGNTVNLVMSLSTMGGIEILSQNGGVGCSAVMRKGIATFGSCAVIDSRSIYPLRAQLSLQFCPFDLQPCPLPLSEKFDIEVSPPVMNISSEVCIDQELCEVNYGPRSCVCKPSFEHLQVANEKFFGTVRASVFDSSGRLVEGSRLLLTATLVSSIGCVDLFGQTSQQVYGGKATWPNLGPYLKNDSFCNPKMGALGALSIRISVSIQAENYNLYSLLAASIPLQLDFPASYLKIESFPKDTIAGKALSPPPSVGLYAIMFSYPCYRLDLIDCVQPVLKSVRHANVMVIPEGYTAQVSLGSNDIILGKKSVPIVNGFAVFTDLCITRVGRYSLVFYSESEFGNLSSIGNISIAIRVGKLQNILIVQQPRKARAFVPQNVSAIITDAYDNPLSCDLGLCPSQLSGYPNMVSTEVWPTLRFSDLMFTAYISPVSNCSSSALVASTTNPDCTCKNGTEMRTSGVRGVGHFCTVSAISMGLFVLKMFVGDLSATSNSFEIISGEPKLLAIKADAPSIIVAGEIVSPPLTVQFVDFCNNVASVGDTQIMVSVPSSCNDIGLTGDQSIVSVGSTAVFSNLQVTKVLELNCRFIFTALELSAMSGNFTVLNSALYQLLVIQQPVASLRGIAITPAPKVQGLDRFGNLVVWSTKKYMISASLLSGQQVEGQCSNAECSSTSVSGKCFKVFQWPSSWAEAQVRCQRWGGNLASLSSSEMNHFASSLAQGPAWIGLSRTVRGSSPFTGWRWSDGISDSPPSPQDTSQGYSNWNPQRRTDGNDNCAAINVDNSSAWTIIPCKMVLPFVCSKPIDTAPADTPQGSTCSCKNMGGQTTQQMIEGIAIFADLKVTGDSAGMFRIIFSGVTMNSVVSATSEPFVVNPRIVQLKVWRQPGDGAANQPLTIQPVLTLLDSFGEVVNSEVTTCYATLNYPGKSGALLLGGVNITSTQGQCKFENILVDRAQNSGYSIRFMASTSLFVESAPFFVSQTAAALTIISAISKKMLAGNTIPAIKIFMLNRRGVNDASSCASHESGWLSGCLIVTCSDMIHVTISGAQTSSLMGNKVAPCKDGFATFTDLSVTEASSSIFLHFSSYYTSLSVQTGFFSVQPRMYSGLTVIREPNNVEAGYNVRVTAGLVDRYTNRVFDSNVTIVAEVILSKTNEIVSKSTNLTGWDGSCSFEFQIMISDSYQIRFKFFTNQTECLESAGYNSSNQGITSMTSDPHETDYTEMILVCGMRSHARQYSKVFVVFSSTAFSIRISRNVSPVSVAGQSFSIQPICEVRDIFENLISENVSIQVFVENDDGGGCICNFKKNSGCDTSLPSPTVHSCASKCPANSIGEEPNFVTSGGIAEMHHLACTKASCIPGCSNSSCGPKNCKLPYRLGCRVIAGLCNPCVAYSNYFEVLPTEISALNPAPVQIVIAGSPSRGIPDSGFFRSKSQIIGLTLPVQSGANFSVKDLER